MLLYPIEIFDKKRSGEIGKDPQGFKFNWLKLGDLRIETAFLGREHIKQNVFKRAKRIVSFPSQNETPLFSAFMRNTHTISADSRMIPATKPLLDQGRNRSTVYDTTLSNPLN